MKWFQGIGTRLGTVGELLGFLWKQKLWWLIPIVLVLLLTGMLLAFAQATGLTRFIYPVF